jgi:type I restriction enzyme R subunit
LPAPALDIITEPYFTDGSGRAPRYYQRVAINRTVEAIARQQQRILLVMATGTGKTYTAFQIIWRLWKSGAKKRILFLVDQTRTNDFKPFGSAMTKITNRTVDKSYEIYLSLYQAVSGTEEAANIYKQFSPDFFDLVIVDECHRGSAADNSAWREILEYFSTATQIGLTATPKETADISTTYYFGDPLYTYSLRQGIDDGFLAPYQVVRVQLDKDIEGWTPEAGETDKHGVPIEARQFNQRDFDRTIILEKRTETVAGRITDFLKGTDRYAKTIVFCENIDHAERMRSALVNLNSDLVALDERYVMRITGDSPEGKAQLDNFIDPESRYPVIATTSKLLSTGVDAQTCKVIVLDQSIRSMTEFKQMIGRGTRIREDYGKRFFTIIDFKQATELFADPAFDGDPVRIYEPTVDDPMTPPTTGDENTASGGEPGGETLPPLPPPTGGGHPYKYVVDRVEVRVINERVEYYGPEGTLITTSLRDYTRARVTAHYAELGDFLSRWNAADRKQVIIEELEAQGVLWAPLAEKVGQAYDPFDLLCHVAYDQPPLTRRERANNVRKRNYFTHYGDQARAVLNALLDKYADEGITSLEDMEVLKVQPLSDLGSPVELVRAFGSRNAYLEAIQTLEQALYSIA